MQLRPRPDLDRLAAAFAARGRVRVPDLLAPAAADRLYACLEHDVPWHLVWNEGDEVRRLSPAAVQALTGAERRALDARIAAGGRDGFQFRYRCYPMVDGARTGQDPGLLLHDVLRFLNGDAMLDLVRRITGMAGIVRCDAQATLYRPGDFLTRHDDQGGPGERRCVAYVLNMTRGWKADWGGLLHFPGPDGEVEEAWVPRYNALALFRVPMMHAVGCVAPFAGGPRYAVTGWWRDA